jgi:hypothetical protein
MGERLHNVFGDSPTKWPIAKTFVFWDAPQLIKIN